MTKRLVLIALFSLMLLASVAQAQDALPPVIAVSKGDLYAINPTDGSIKQLTNHPSIAGGAGPFSQRDVSISPDGQYVAYLQTPRFFAIAMKNNLIGNFGFPPSDIVLLNLATGEEKVIAEQQANVKYSDGPRLWYRENLTWSPSATTNQLAYYQYRGYMGDPNYEAQLMVYDPLIDKTFTIADGKDYLGKIAWVQEGFEAGATVWDTNSQIVAQHVTDEQTLVGKPLTYQGVEYVMVDNVKVIPHDGRVYLMNILTGEYGVVEGYESSISQQSPENSLVFVMDDNDTRPAYVVKPQTGEMFTPPKQAPYAVDFSFAPDGQHFAYILIRTSVNISDMSGNEVVVPFDADTIIWSAKQYTVASKTGDQSAPVMPTTDLTPYTAPAPQQNCGSLPPVGLVAGGQGKVIVGGGPNRIRNTPSASAAVIGQIPEGAIFTVIVGGDGTCSDDIRWVQIESQGVIGWTAEGANGQVFLEPVQ
jgi:hypothetical protein